MEEQIIALIAHDRLEIPLSSMYQKIKRAKQRDAKNLALSVKVTDSHEFEGSRAYAYVDKENKEKARGMKEAIKQFSTEYPQHGAILEEMIKEKREIAEEHMYFGVQTGCRLTTEDYIAVLCSTGLSESTAKAMYPDLINVSRKLAKEREEERSIIVGKYGLDGKIFSEDAE